MIMMPPVPKKSLGQNFMADPAMLVKMAESANLTPDSAVLEIGAGMGALTAELALRARRVVATEIDDRFMPHLRHQFADRHNVHLVLGDILTLDLTHLMGEDAPNYTVCANLPYYITSAILRHLLENLSPPRLIVVTVQLEVARRIIATPDDMSLLAVSVQFYGRPEILRRLKPGVFTPRPEVESAIIRITPHPQGALLPPVEWIRFFRLARAGFSQPRKQIKNSLSAGLATDQQDVLNLLERAGIDPMRRAETLSLQEWVALHGAFTLHSNGSNGK
jgi:16S rRNA (adenine1518-N6/adenine1519-N6)-dimethyltransferase